MNPDIDFDGILDEAFETFPDIDLPPSFTDDLVRRIEKRLTWQMLLTEFGLKIALVTGALLVVIAALLFPFKNIDAPFIDFLYRHWQIAASIGAISFFTFLFDQVVLRYLIHRKRFT